jgi:hypothetical protein
MAIHGGGNHLKIFNGSDFTSNSVLEVNELWIQTMPVRLSIITLHLQD